MEIRDLYREVAPFIVSLTFYEKDKGEFFFKGSGSGFLTGDGYLVTNFHVMEKVLLAAQQPDKCLLRVGYFSEIRGNLPIFSKIDFLGEDIKTWITGCDSSERVNDFIILNTKLEVRNNQKEIKKIDFLTDDVAYIGQKVCIFGYPFGKENLSMNQGIISSIYERCGVKVFQIDGIVNNGNSGGPLIDVDTGKVIGIVSRKEDGLNELFKQLKATIEKNIEIAHNASQMGGVVVCGISHTEAIEKTFIAIRELIDHIERSANVGIGYAFSLNKIIEDLKQLRIDDEPNKESTPHSTINQTHPQQNEQV